MDLSNAYHHVPIHRAHKKYLRFHFQGILYQYRALVMGLTSSQCIFTRISKYLYKFLQSTSILVHRPCTIGSSKEQTEDWTSILLELVLSLCFVVNLAKSDLQPNQDFQFMSYHLMLAQGKVVPTEKRCGKIQQKILPFLHSTHCTARTWQSLIGLLTSLKKLVGLGMLNIRDIQVAMLNRWSPFRANPEELPPVEHVLTNEVKVKL